MAFSISGDKLAAVGIDKDHTVYIFDAKNGSFITSMKGDVNIICGIQFKDDTEFVTIGVKHFKFWKFQNKAIQSK